MAGQRLTHWDRIPAVHKDFYQVDQTILKGFRMDYAGMTNLDSSDKKKPAKHKERISIIESVFVVE